MNQERGLTLVDPDIGYVNAPILTKQIHIAENLIMAGA